MWALPDDWRIWTAYAALIALLTVLTFGSLGGYPNATSGGLAGQINAFRDTGIPSAL